MKLASSALSAYLAGFSGSADRAIRKAELYTITLQAGSIAGIATGQTLTYTDIDLPVAWNSATFVANGPQISGLRYKGSCGPDADSTQIAIAARDADTVGGAPLLRAIALGLLDGAEIQRERAFFSSFDGTPLVPIGTVILFKGRVAKIDSVSRTQAKVTVESDLTLLKRQMPRNFYAPSCVWTLYDTGCSVVRASHTFTGAAGSGSTASLIVYASADASFQQGVITFTSGVNAGITATIKTAATGLLTLIYPLPVAPAAGDAFSVSRGCDHTRATCDGRFANLANFRGFPYIPPPQIVTGPLASTANAGKG